MNPLALIARFINWLADYRDKQAALAFEIDDCHKCPSCGILRQHKIRFTQAAAEKGNDVLGVIEHTCARCDAKFFEPTVVPIAKWMSSRRPQRGEVPIKRVSPIMPPDPPTVTGTVVNGGANPAPLAPPPNETR